MRTFVVIVIAAASTAVFAQTPPPIRPGLWELRPDAGGNSLSEAAAGLQRLPPAQRQQVEAAMKQRGIDLSSGVIRMCLSAESLANGDWQKNQGGTSGRCKIDYSSQTTSRWAWKSVCSAPAVTSEGEVLFMGDKAYDITSTTTTMVDGQPRVDRVTMRSKWLAADCGDVKPVRKF